MSERNPTIENLFGVGTPRLIIKKDKQSGYIKSNTEDNGTYLTVTTLFPHGLIAGQKIRFDVESDSGQLTGDVYVLSTPTDKIFTIHILNADADTGGHFESLNYLYESSTQTEYSENQVLESNNPDFTTVKVNQRIVSYVGTDSNKLETHAKILSVTPGTVGIITIDNWTNGIPTDGNRFFCDGWIADLPRCQNMIETYEPDILVHELYNGDYGISYETEIRGFKYTCILDYSQYASGDLIYSLRRQLAQKTKDTLILIPRRDKYGRQFEVFFIDKIEIQRYGKSYGYKKFSLAFQSKMNVSAIVNEYSSTRYDGGI